MIDVNEGDALDIVFADGTIPFAERLIASERFRDLFREGMGLLEETADYLDGDGRRDSKTLSRLGGLAYAAESMKLTTRLMQLASWLLVHRAVAEREMEPPRARKERSKIKLADPAGDETSAGFDELPTILVDLIERSQRLQARIRHLDMLAYEEAQPAEPRDSAVHSQLDQIAKAFGNR